MDSADGNPNAQDVPDVQHAPLGCLTDSCLLFAEVKTLTVKCYQPAFWLNVQAVQLRQLAIYCNRIGRYVLWSSESSPDTAHCSGELDGYVYDWKMGSYNPVVGCCYFDENAATSGKRSVALPGGVATATGSETGVHFIECKNCGSKAHKGPDCTAGTKQGESPKARAKAKAPGSQRGVADTSQAPPADVNQQHIKSMLADAAMILQQVMPNKEQGAGASSSTVQAVPIAGAPTQADPVQGTPVSLASIQAQIESLKAAARDHEAKASIRMVEPDTRIIKAVALLDSGATHAVSLIAKASPILKGFP
ncbi:unnamed protein product [Symbiodinium sp. CCMP2592]|nr:unnamed protein product [Symbiodinium sp. CCMP2592]